MKPLNHQPNNLTHSKARKTKDGYVIEKDADPDQGKFSVYTSIYDLEKLFEKEQEYITHINTIIEKKLVGNHAETGLGMYSAR